MTNAECVADEIRRNFKGEHEHQPLTGGRAGPVQDYPQELCRVICRGIVKQLKMRRMAVKSIMKLETRVQGSEMDFADKYHDADGEEVGR